MFYLIFNLLAAKSGHTFTKIEFEFYDNENLLKSGKVDPATPECTYNFVIFLLCVCDCDLIISHNLNYKLKIIGEEMKRRGLSTDKKNTPHLDIKDKLPPNAKAEYITISEISSAFFNQCKSHENIAIYSAQHP